MPLTGYSLPFEFVYPGEGLGQAEAINVRFEIYEQTDIAQVESALNLFSALASIGALGGVNIPPHLCAFGPITRVSANTESLLYRVQSCRIADEAVVVLSNLLLALQNSVPIRSVKILAGPEAPLHRLARKPGESTYPALYSAMPFEIDNSDPEGGGFSFEMDLESPLGEDSVAHLNALCRTWTQGILRGAYALPPMPPESSYVEVAAEEVVAYDSHVEWAVFKLTADPAASLNGFLNALAAFHARQVRIRLLEIL